MAKPGPPAKGGDDTTPAPPSVLHVTLTELPKGHELHRVHLSRFTAEQFNPGLGNARFSPIKNEKGGWIPTLYAGTTMECALMESVFHDVPHTAGFKSLDKGKLDNQLHSVIRIQQTLQLVDLTGISLRKLGVLRRQLIDTEKDQYPQTRAWAEAIHRHSRHAQGLIWVSRQDDSARAIVLFGDRISAGTLLAVGRPRSLLGDPDAYDKVLDLAERIGVNLVPGLS